MNAIVLLVFFLSTTLFPAGELSDEMAIWVNLSPFTHVVNVIRALMLQGDIVINDVIFVILLFAVMRLISFSWALYRLKK